MAPGQKLNLDCAAFLREYWQRKPLLIRNAIDNFTPPLDGDDLAGLALEPDVESRLIEYRAGKWLLEHGPFTAADFTRVGAWTLLVQAVDHYVPEVAGLRTLVDFLPRWRLDDIMVSYATDGGGVGPHYDNYDVFLLQGEGRRLWRLGGRCDASTPLSRHDDLRILAHFESEEEFVLGPGDMLYVPPGVAHWGIAEGECTTFSIGFRAPRRSDMLSRLTDELLERLPTEQFFEDAGRSPARRPGELQSDDIARAIQQARQALEAPVSARWFGELITEPRDNAEPQAAEIARAARLLRRGARCIWLSGAAKLAWHQDGHSLTVFANGESLDCALPALPSLMLLCSGDALSGTDLDTAQSDPDTARMLHRLVQLGCIDVEK